MENKQSLLIDDRPVDLSHYTDEELEQIFQERFGEFVNEQE